ncbi:MAG TPA: isoleucine--tRNA ligase, partial [Nitrospirae bacterium]|nr:isoleucine--tRNA ligase [Nitrospirota bacterium]
MAKDYKDTLNLPSTGFPMKANLTRKEPECLKYWEEGKIYEKMLGKNHRDNSYILHDGPPYANGHIHIGHALNKILKDIIIKYRTMKGYYSPYIPGWDCHGLPIELQVDKKLGSKKHETGIVEKRKLCREYAEKFIDIQRDEFRRLGVLGDWKRPYLTMTHDYEATILKEFYRFLEKGYVYRGRKPVHWCPSCVTALAEAEVEYNEKSSPSVYVKFRVTDKDADRLIAERDNIPVNIIIWTTTPWTLPANLALAVHPDISYVVVKEKEYFIVAEPLLENLRAVINLHGDTANKFKGSELAGIRTIHPFIDRESAVVTGDFVTVEEGTGIVHIAPGHGEDDYEIGLKHGLDIYAPVDDHGKFTKDVPEFEGQFVFKANAAIIEALSSRNTLIGRNDITHSYPHCWRCKKPVIFRATEQWFISLEKDNLRDKCLEEIDKVSWIPSWGKERITAMMKNRPDWCISRQRSWGIPIAVLTCEECEEVVKDGTILDFIVQQFREKSSDIWFDVEIKDLLPDGYRCGKCGGRSFRKEMDILDVWFDSGVSHAAVMENDERLDRPADMYLEGSDQHRGWFQSSLITSTATRGKAPFRTVLTHGFVVDGAGKKMSKSVGNVIAPQDIIKRNGAETLRLWVSAEDYRGDVRISNEIIQRLTEAYRKIRNTCRFLLGNINDFDNGNYTGSLLEIDRWAMSRLQNLIINVTSAYDNCDFHEAFHRLHNFCIVDMSNLYLDILKDRIYTFGRSSTERRAAQWTMNRILLAITKLMAPILSFTAEEVWKFIRPEDEESVFLSDFPQVNTAHLNEALEQKWEGLKKIRDEVNRALELKRKEKFIGNSLEARVSLSCNDKLFSLLEEYLDFLPALFIVSQVELHRSGEQKPEIKYTYKSDEIEELSVMVQKADGSKCERCWNYSSSVGT